MRELHELKLRFAVVKLLRTHPDAVTPSQREGDVGFDLHSVQDGRIHPGETVAIDTGWKIADAIQVDGIDPFTAYMKIEQRSSLALKGIFPVGGIIDPSYRGPLKVMIHNGCNSRIPGEGHWDLKVGDRIGQLVIYPVLANTDTTKVKFFEVDEDEATETERGEGGFGSTGR